MAKCNWCEREMLKVDTCEGNKELEFPDGERMGSIPYDFDDKERRCHDCTVKVGGFHHPGCDMEVCPRCKGQLISCGCLDV